MNKKYLKDTKDLMKEYNNLKNTNIDLENITLGSNKKIWWKCSQGHEWQTNISNRNNGAGCPFCAGKQVLKGYNDLATVNPTLAKEWNNEKNGNLKPDMVSANSNKKVWWKCPKGHEWHAFIYNRNKGTGCPTCKKK